MANEKPQQPKMNVNIEHNKEAFFATDLGTSISPSGVVIDFRQVLPRLDSSPEGTTINTISVKHNPVIMNPLTAKMLLNLLREQIQKLEKDVGEIKLPDKWKSEKEKASVTKKAELDNTTSYIG